MRDCVRQAAPHPDTDGSRAACLLACVRVHVAAAYLIHVLFMHEFDNLRRDASCEEVARTLPPQQLEGQGSQV